MRIAVLTLMFLVAAMASAQKIERSKPDADDNVVFVYVRPDGMEKCYQVSKRGNRKAIPCDVAKDKLKKLGRDTAKLKGNPQRKGNTN